MKLGATIATTDLRVADLATFLAVVRTRSVTGAARELGVTPSQVSKAVTRIERYCGAKLFVRGTKGVTVTDGGERVAGLLSSALASIEATRAHPGSATEARRIPLTVAGPSYLLETLLPTIAGADPRLRVRALELSPPLIRAYITENTYDVAVLPGAVAHLPSTWRCDSIGVLRKALFGPPALAKRLAPLPTTEARIRELPWITPAAGNKRSPVADDCPIPVPERKVGHEAQTMRTALDLAASGDFLVFGPEFAARKLVREGAMVEIPVRGWDIREPLSLVCNGEVVLAKVRDALVRALRSAVAE